MGALGLNDGVQAHPGVRESTANRRGRSRLIGNAPPPIIPKLPDPPHLGTKGLEPGDEFEIKLGRKQIKLIPAGAEAEED